VPDDLRDGGTAAAIAAGEEVRRGGPLLAVREGAEDAEVEGADQGGKIDGGDGGVDAEHDDSCGGLGKAREQTIVCEGGCAFLLFGGLLVSF